MKKITYLLGLAITLCFGACSPEVEDIFDKDSSDRLNEVLVEAKEVLTGAEHGWLMEYYPAKSLVYGGYNVLVKFEDNDKLTVASELADPDAVAVSTFRLKSQAGPVLTFDTYNDIFHIFCDPQNDMNVGNPGLGFEGDYEFTIMEATPEKVTLKGKKTGNVIVMTPMGTEMSWEAYLKKIQAASKNVEQYFRFQYNMMGTSFEAPRSMHTLSISYIDESGEDRVEMYPFIITLEGLKFIRPIEILGTYVDFLYYNSSKDIWVSEDGIVTLKGTLPSENEILQNYGPWFISYENLVGSYTKQKFDEAYDKMYGEEGPWRAQELSYFGFGSNLIYTNFSATLIMDYDNQEGADLTKVACLAIDTRFIGDNTLSLRFNGYGDEYNLGNAAYEAGMFSFIASFQANEFMLTVDNKTVPSKLTLVDKSNPDNKFIIVNKMTKFGYPNLIR